MRDTPGLSQFGLISFYSVVASLAMTHHDKTRSHALDWRFMGVIGAVEDLLDKKSDEVHLSVNEPKTILAKAGVLKQT